MTKSSCTVDKNVQNQVSTENTNISHGQDETSGAILHLLRLIRLLHEIGPESDFRVFHGHDETENTNESTGETSTSASNIHYARCSPQSP